MAWMIAVFTFLSGALLLGWSAQHFVSSSEVLALKLSLPPLVIGLLFVGFGTSFPELVVAAMAAWHGHPIIAVGNSVGSNIINIGLVVGLMGLLMPLEIRSQLLRREFPLLVAVTVLVGALLYVLGLSRFFGVLLLALLAGYLLWLLVWLPRSEGPADAMAEEYAKEMPAAMSASRALCWWVFSLALLYVSSELLVNSAVSIARWLQISDRVIGLTVVALGTSLPELATCVTSAIRRDYDVVLGNIIGSNLFNLLAVLAVPALIAPAALPKQLLSQDYPIMLLFTLGFWGFATIGHQRCWARVGGVVLIGALLGYLLLLF